MVHDQFPSVKSIVQPKLYSKKRGTEAPLSLMVPSAITAFELPSPDRELHRLHWLMYYIRNTSCHPAIVFPAQR